MAEAPIDNDTAAAKKNPRAAQPKKKAPAVIATPAPPAGRVGDWRVWGVVGLGLVVALVAWKLLGTSYKADVRTVCSGEAASGFALDHDQSKVTAYVREHLGTPEGNEFFSTLSDTKLLERAKRLQSEATAQGIADCPAVASYQKLAAAGEYRGDLQHLCSVTAFPHFGELDEAGRLQRLEDWIAQGAKSPRTKELADGLRPGTPADRAKLLRDTATKADVFNCELSKVLEGPLLPAKGKGAPTVRVYTEPQIIGVFRQDDLKKALADATPAMTECYKKGLEKKLDLEGRLAVKIKVDPAGKVTSATPGDESFSDGDTAMCIVQVIKGMELPKNPGPLVSILIPLEMTTVTTGPTAGTLPLVVPPSLARPADSGAH